LKPDLSRREAYALRRVNAALTRLIEAESGSEIARANRWVKAWLECRQALLGRRNLLQPKDPRARWAGQNHSFSDSCQ